MYAFRYCYIKGSWLPEDMGPKKLGDSLDLDSLVSPIYALTTVGVGMNSTTGWMGYKAVPIDEPKPRSTLFLIDVGLSPKTLDALLHILIICLVLFIIINCLCKFLWLFLKWRCYDFFVFHLSFIFKYLVVLYEILI